MAMTIEEIESTIDEILECIGLLTKSTEFDRKIQKITDKRLTALEDKNGKDN